MYLKTIKRLYKEAIKKEDFDFIDEILTYEFWNLKKVQKAFKKYTENWRNPNIHDTCCYKYMKPSEQALFEGTFMDRVLNGEIDI